MDNYRRVSTDIFEIVSSDEHSIMAQFVAESFIARKEKLGLSNMDIFRNLESLLDFKSGTFRNEIKYLNDGKFMRFDVGWDAHLKKLKRYSIVFYHLGFNEGDDMINQIKNLYPHFEYPPANFEIIERK